MNTFLRWGTTALLVAAGCTQAQATPLPEWVTALPDAPGRMYAVGAAQISEEGSEAKAISRAGEHAKVELLSTLRTNVNSSQESRATLKVSRTDTSNNSGFEQQVQKKTVITASARDLPGLTIRESFIDRQNQSVYALAELDLSAATAELDRRQQKLEARLAEVRAMKNPELAEIGRAENFLQQQASTLDMAALLASRIGSQAARIQATHDDFRRALADLKKGVTFGLNAQGAENRSSGALMGAVTKAGYSWSAAPRYRFTINGGDNRQFAFNFGRHVVKASMNLLLEDSAGTVVKTAKINATGNGATEAAADRQLNKRFDEEIETHTREWLGVQEASEPENTAATESAANATTGDQYETPGSSDKPVSWGTH